MNPILHTSPQKRATRLPIHQCVMSVIRRDTLCIGDHLRVLDARNLAYLNVQSNNTLDWILVTNEQGTYLGVISYHALMQANSGAVLNTLIESNYPTAFNIDNKYTVARDLLSTQAAFSVVLDSRQRVVGILERATALSLIGDNPFQPSHKTPFFRRLYRRFFKA